MSLFPWCGFGSTGFLGFEIPPRCRKWDEGCTHPGFVWEGLFPALQQNLGLRCHPGPGIQGGLFPGFFLCLAAMPGSSVMAHWALFFIPGALAGKIRRRRGNPNPNKPAAGILSGARQGKLICIGSRSSSKLLALQ